MAKREDRSSTAWCSTAVTSVHSGFIPVAGLSSPSVFGYSTTCALHRTRQFFYFFKICVTVSGIKHYIKCIKIIPGKHPGNKDARGGRLYSLWKELVPVCECDCAGKECVGFQKGASARRVAYRYQQHPVLLLPYS